MKKVKLLLASVSMVLLGAFAFVPATTVGALDPLDGACASDPDSVVCDNRTEDAGDLVGPIINTLLFLVGLLSVVMIIVSGIFYVISSGDAGKVAKAKNTLTYAIVGLIVAFLAYAIINWVFQLF